MSEGLKRREFLKVVGLRGAGSGVVGCSTEKVEHRVPYVVPPEDITPGVATWYTTACSECEAACGMWVRTREGRVVKVEGNPDHPVSRGALCSRGHSSLQGLYNPDRYPGPMARQNGRLQPISWEDVKVPPNCGRREAKFLREAAHRFRFPGLDDLQNYVSSR